MNFRKVYISKWINHITGINNQLVYDPNKVKNKEGVYKILGEIIKIHDAGIYDILIAKDHEEYNLYKNDICRVSRELFKVISFNVWEELKNEE